MVSCPTLQYVCPIGGRSLHTVAADVKLHPAEAAGANLEANADHNAFPRNSSILDHEREELQHHGIGDQRDSKGVKGRWSVNSPVQLGASITQCRAFDAGANEHRLRR